MMGRKEAIDRAVLGGGSGCGRAMGREVVVTVGFRGGRLRTVAMSPAEISMHIKTIR